MGDAIMGKPLSLVSGTLELLVLQVLAGGQPLHGFEILDAIRRATDDELLVEEGALYPALHRMDQKGWLGADWAVSEKGRRAKYYRLVAKGRRALERTQAEWLRYVELVDRVAKASSV
jgi:PadR family transcriptional regulator